MYGGTPFVARMPGVSHSGIEIGHFGTAEEAALAVAREQRDMKRRRDADGVPPPPVRPQLPPEEVDSRLFAGAAQQGWRIEFTVCRRPEATTFGKKSYVFIHIDPQTGTRTRFQPRRTPSPT